MLYPIFYLKTLYQYHLIKKSRLLNRNYYLSQLEQSEKIKRASIHYILHSWENLANPCPDFDTEYYVRQRPYILNEIKTQHISPLYHYLRYGIRDNLNPNPHFNTLGYLQQNPDVAQAGVHPFVHYIQFGKTEQRDTGVNWNEVNNPIGQSHESTYDRIAPKDSIITYEKWRNKNRLTAHDLKLQRGIVFHYTPLISIIVPVHKPPLRFFKELIDSIRNQSYANWELCLSDSSHEKELTCYIETLKEKDSRIRSVAFDTPQCISANSNAAVELSTGEFLAFIDHDDLLEPNALFEMVNILNADPTLDFIYSDEDKVSEDSQTFFDPFFKPDWSPDTFMSMMYTNHFSLLRKSLFRNVGGFRIGYSGAQDYDLILRVTEETKAIHHIPQVLYHWRVHSQSIAKGIETKDYAVEALKRAKTDAMKRRGIKGKLYPSERFPGQFKVNYEVQGTPLVSVIIPTKNQYEILKTCLDSLIQNTSYPRYEILVVDNQSDEPESLDYLNSLEDDSRIRVLKYDRPFNFSAINNRAVDQAKGDYILLLNNDIEVLEEGWMESMLGYAQLSHIGAVGAQLLFPQTNSIQHCGILNLYDGPGHALYNFPSQAIYHFGRNDLDYNWIAVTGACLMIKTDLYKEAGGMDEDLKVAYNDVDLCFKLIKMGKYNVCCNSVKLYHHESVSRGIDHVDREKSLRLQKERQGLYQKHPEFYQYDPFYNIHLHQRSINFDLGD